MLEMEANSVEWIQAICNWLRNSSSDAAADQIGAWLEQAPTSDLDQLLEALAEGITRGEQNPRRWRLLMQLLTARVVRRRSASRGARASTSTDNTDEQAASELGAELDPGALADLFRDLAELDGAAAAHALQILAAQRDEESIQLLAATMADSPPNVWQHAAVALSPLWNASGEELELFFDRLQYHDPSPITLAVLLDLANFAVSKRRLREHPWSERAEQLQQLLQRLVLQLEKLQVRPDSFGSNVSDVQRILGDSISLCISLCHALGLIGEPTAIDALRGALDLSHRYIQTEAANALTRLGDQEGKSRLLQLASDPVARGRVVAFAEELGIADEIDEQLREPNKLAESELCAWLAEPDKFGIPPTTTELIDARTLYWPSYVEPRNCYLFRFTYQFIEQSVTNIGIAGPTTHAFLSNLSELSIDDMYAAFAGWDVEHEEIYAIPMPMLNMPQRTEADRQIAYLEAAGFERIEPHSLTFMLGQVALLAKLTRDGQVYWGVTDLTETVVFPTSNKPDALSDQVVLGIYRGRKILRTFNDENLD